MGFSGVNFLSIFVAAVAGWLFAAIYYTAISKQWLAAQGKTVESCTVERNSRSAVANAAPFVIALLGNLVIGWVLYGILTHLHTFTLRAGLISGCFCWFGFVVTTMTVNNAFQMRSVKLTLLDAIGWLGVFLIIGAIIGWWGR